MSRSTGENESGLLRILETIRIASIILLLIHFYLAFHDYPNTTAGYDAETSGSYDANPGNLANQASGHLTDTVRHLPVVGNFLGSKTIALLLLGVSLIGASGRKSPENQLGRGAGIVLAGLALFFASGLLASAAVVYILCCSTGWLLVLYGGNYISRIIWNRPVADLFNRLHESFPQEQRRLENSRSVNLPAMYLYHGEQVPSWVNIVSPQRATLVLGASGSGKTVYVLQHFIRQMVQKGYSMVIHDFKYDDLSKLAYNVFLQHQATYPATAGFYNIQFDDLNHSNRCNLLHPSTLADITDAEESARSLLLGLNLDWIAKQGEFFVESAVSFVKMLIWFLRVYDNGTYCSWPHVIELAHTPLKRLLTILRCQPELQATAAPFVEALTSGANEQLAGQIATALIGLSRLSSPRLYYVLTGNDFTLDLNDPQAPKILTLGNNPRKATTYGPFISAYLNTISRLANRKGAAPLAMILEEFSTIAVHTIDKTIATARSNNVAVTICCQNVNQLKHTYGDKFADVIINTCGNIISGQVTGDTAKLLAERFGKTLQQRQSLTTTYSDVSISDAGHLEFVIPESRIASLSSGEFVGMVADTPDQPIECKMFSCRLPADFTALEKEEASFQPLPATTTVTRKMLNSCFFQVRQEVIRLTEAEYDRISHDAALCGSIIE